MSNSGGPRAATIYDVARRAGVSHQTVSRFLRGYDGIRPATRSKVIAALEELDYRPNSAARALKAGRSSRIAALTHEAPQVGPTAVIRGATLAAREAGYLLDVVALDAQSTRSITTALAGLHQQDLDGVIALASTDEMSAAFAQASFAAPVVRAEELDDSDRGVPSDLSDNGIPALVSHLHSLGHQHVLHIAGPMNWSAARNRVEALNRALRGHSMPPARVANGDWSAASGYQAMKTADRQDITAVVAANDQMALGAILALHDDGVLVPETMSVTGIDDIPESGYFLPPLTTIRVDFEEQGRSAVMGLLNLLGHEVRQPHSILESKLVVRRSTGPKRAP